MTYDKVIGHKTDGHAVTHVTVSRKCAVCGKPIRDDTDNFCPNCGHEYAHKLAYAVPVKTVVALLNAEARKGDSPE